MVQNGIRILFGGLVGNKMFEVFGGGGFIFAFRVLPVIIFFSSLIAVLYYLGIMRWVIKLLGWWPAESTGHLPYRIPVRHCQHLRRPDWKPAGGTSLHLQDDRLPSCSPSCGGGLASVASSVLAGYASMGVKMEYLIAASFMAARVVCCSPSCWYRKPRPQLRREYRRGRAGRQAGQRDRCRRRRCFPAGLQLALNVGAMLLAFIGLISP